MPLGGLDVVFRTLLEKMLGEGKGENLSRVCIELEEFGKEFLRFGSCGADTHLELSLTALAIAVTLSTALHSSPCSRLSTSFGRNITCGRIQRETGGGLSWRL